MKTAIFFNKTCIVMGTHLCFALLSTICFPADPISPDTRDPVAIQMVAAAVKWIHMDAELRIELQQLNGNEDAARLIASTSNDDAEHSRNTARISLTSDDVIEIASAEPSKQKFYVVRHSDPTWVKKVLQKVSHFESIKDDALTTRALRANSEKSAHLTDNGDAATFSESPSRRRQADPVHKHHSDPSGSLHVVAMGVNSFRAATNLRGCVNDAIAFSSAINHLAVSNHLFLDDKATADAVLSRLANIVREADSGDTVVFFASSHGAEDFSEYFILTTESTDAIAGSIPMGLLSKLLSYREDLNVVFISDTCHGGSSGFDVERFKQGGSFSVLTACFPDEFSIETSRVNPPMGLFTYFIVKGLKDGALNKRKEITLGSLYDYVFLEMKEFEELSAHGQHPMFFGRRNIRLR